MRDVPVLEPLVRVAERIGEDLILFGSAASRAALLHAAGRYPSSLLDLAEHGTDLDLAHTAGPEVTQSLRAEIERQVPLAPWLRWSIIDRSGWLAYEAQESMNVRVPLRQVRLATHPALSAPQEEAVAMALDGVVRFDPGDGFGRSPRAAYDTEVSGALLHLDAAIDAAVLRRVSKLEGPLSWDRGAMQQAIEAGAARLQQLEGLGRALAERRIWYRFVAVAMRLPLPFGDLDYPPYRDLAAVLSVLGEAGYEPALRAHALQPSHPLVVSAALAGGGFRFDPAGDGAEWLVEGPEAPDAAFSKALEEAAVVGEALELAASDRILAGVTGLRVRQGGAPSEGPAGTLGQDFVHLSFEPDKASAARPAEDLSAIAAGRGRRGTVLLPAFAVVSRGPGFGDLSIEPEPDHGRRRLTIRLNLAGMLGEVDSLDVFLVGRSLADGR